MAPLLSLCMIVKDEEEVLSRALDGVSPFCDEIVIADTGSTDSTVEIARRYTDRVFDFEWTDDFAAARNFSFSKAAGEYVMWLDADDIVTPENGERLKKLRERLIREAPDTVMCRYDAAFDAQGRTTFSYIRERVLKREGCPPWQGFVHECISPFGKIVFSHFTVRHGETPGKVRGRRNLDIYQRHVAAGEKLDARHMLYYGRELTAHRLYREAEGVLEDAVRDSEWDVGRIEACKVLADCLLAQGKREKAVETLFSSFRFGEPRAQVLCKLGAIFRAEGRLKEAVYWYTASLSAKDFTLLGDFDQPEYRTVIPLVELTACFWQLGEKEKAFKCHTAALELSPDHPAVRFNEDFFRAHGHPSL